MHVVSFSNKKITTPVVYCNLRLPHSVKPLNKFLGMLSSWIRCDNYLLQRCLTPFSILISCFFQEVINLLKTQGREESNTDTGTLNSSRGQDLLIIETSR
jgi:hypothetical protein